MLGSVYRYQTHDYIRSVNNQFNNTSGGGTNGAELEFEKHWDSNIRLRTSVAIQSAEDGNGYWQVNSPRQIGKMNLSVPFLHQAWHAAFKMQAYTERNTSAGGYSLANLTISTDKLLPNLGMSFGIRNLFDRDYVYVAPNSNNKQVVISQTGRSYWLRMTYDFK